MRRYRLSLASNKIILLSSLSFAIQLDSLLLYLSITICCIHYLGWLGHHHWACLFIISIVLSPIQFGRPELIHLLPGTVDGPDDHPLGVGLAGVGTQVGNGGVVESGGLPEGVVGESLEGDLVVAELG